MLSVYQDPFFQKSMYLNFGDLGQTIKEYVDEYQNRTQSSMKIDSVADMKRFVEEYPEFRRLSGNVSKHVTLVSELSRRTERMSLLRISELEQSLACNYAHNSDLKTLRELLNSGDIRLENKLRLVMLYALRYEKHGSNALTELLQILLEQGLIEQQVKLVYDLIAYCGADQRQDDLFESENIFAPVRNVFRGLKGVENVYTQHSPHLARTIDLLLKNRLKETSYPFIDTAATNRDKPQDVIIFMVGGTTFAEERVIYNLNSGNSGVRIVLGGTVLHNSSSFIEQWKELASRIGSTKQIPMSAKRRASRS